MAKTEQAAPPKKLPLIPGLIVLVLLGVAVFGEKGVMCAIRSKQEKDQLQQKVRAVEEANQSLREEIDALRSDPRYIETVAREELGMVRGDELVYQFRTGKKPQTASAPVAAVAGGEDSPPR